MISRRCSGEAMCRTRQSIASRRCYGEEMCRTRQSMASHRCSGEDMCGEHAANVLLAPIVYDSGYMETGKEIMLGICMTGICNSGVVLYSTTPVPICFYVKLIEYVNHFRTLTVVQYCLTSCLCFVKSILS